MDFFQDVHSVRLLGHKGKYLWADDDRRSVAQKKGKDSYGVIWRVELVPERNAIRLKSVYDIYLMASDYPFLLGATGKKVMQSFDARAENVVWEPIRASDTSVKFRTRGDKFLRANGGVPPYRNSVTHDVPVLASNQHVVLWEVEVVRRREPTTAAPAPKQSVVVPLPKSPPSLRPPQGSSAYDPDTSVSRPRSRQHSAPTEIDFPLPSPSGSSSPSERLLPPVASPSCQRRRSPPRGRVPISANSLPCPPKYDDDDYDDPSRDTSRAPRQQPATRFTTASHHDEDDDSSLSEASSPPRTPTLSNLRIVDMASPGMSPKVKSPSDFRRIFYTVAEDDGQELAHEDDTFDSFLFKGHTLQELTEALQLETGIDEDVILCMRNPLTSQLYKMRLQLPPNKAPLSVVVVRHNSQSGRTLSVPGTHQRT